MVGRLSGLEPYVSKTNFGLNMATNMCFYQKNMVTNFLAEISIFKVFSFFLSVRAFKFCMKGIFQNFIFKEGSLTSVPKFWAK